MKIAIVGASKRTLTDHYHVIAERQINHFIKMCIASHKKDPGLGELVIISGHSPMNGVDIIVEMEAQSLGVKTEIYPPAVNNISGYRERNQKIARACDKLINYVVSAKDKRTNCYHCNMRGSHQRSGGCWCMKMTKALGKPTSMVVLN